MAMTKPDPDGTYPNQRPWAKPTDPIPLPPDLIVYLATGKEEPPEPSPSDAPGYTPPTTDKAH